LSLIYGRDAEVAAWVAAHIPHVDKFGPCSAIGFEIHGRLVAGFVWHEWMPAFATVQLSIAAISPMWARRQTMRALLSYPFDQLGVFKIWTVIPADNTHAINSGRHAGFHHEATLTHQLGPDRHVDFAYMLRDDYARLYGG
jgi:RimJ/RimL family protein N-acetyltransferase